MRICKDAEIFKDVWKRTPQGMVRREKSWEVDQSKANSNLKWIKSLKTGGVQLPNICISCLKICRRKREFMRQLDSHESLEKGQGENADISENSESSEIFFQFFLVRLFVFPLCQIRKHGQNFPRFENTENIFRFFENMENVVIGSFTQIF